MTRPYSLDELKEFAPGTAEYFRILCENEGEDPEAARVVPLPPYTDEKAWLAPTILYTNPELEIWSSDPSQKRHYTAVTKHSHPDEYEALVSLSAV